LLKADAQKNSFVRAGHTPGRRAVFFTGNYRLVRPVNLSGMDSPHKRTSGVRTLRLKFVKKAPYR